MTIKLHYKDVEHFYETALLLNKNKMSFIPSNRVYAEHIVEALCEFISEYMVIKRCDTVLKYVSHVDGFNEKFREITESAINNNVPLEGFIKRVNDLLELVIQSNDFDTDFSFYTETNEEENKQKRLATIKAGKRVIKKRARS